MRTKGSGQRDHKFRFSSSVNPTHSPEQSGAGLSAGAHADLLKLPAVRHRGDHLGQFLLLTLQHSVDVLRRYLLGGWGGGQRGRRSFNGAVKLSWQMELNLQSSKASIRREINTAASDAGVLFLDLCTIFNLRRTLAASLLMYSRG